MKTYSLLFLALFLASCASRNVERDDGTLSVPDPSGFTTGPAFLQDDDPINKHQQYLGAGFQNQ